MQHLRFLMVFMDQFFYRLTGLHGFHVIVGTAFLAVARYRRAAQHYTVSTHTGYEAAA